MYLVTGATGFIGKHLLDCLVRRGGEITCLVRPGSRDRLAKLVAERFAHAADRIHAEEGDIGTTNAGIPDARIRQLKGKIQHVFHLAARYDMGVSLADAERANVEGTRNVVALTTALGATLHYASSIVVAGSYRGHFREDMFDEGQKHEHPYFLTKFLAERVVRDEAAIPYRIYRPGAVIGSAKTGEADKIDGPYYAFKLIQRLRHHLPEWAPLIGFEGGTLPIVPVDYVAESMDHIAHAEGLDGQTFHLVDPKPPSFGEALNIFCRAAHAPRFSARVDNAIIDLVPTGVFAMLGKTRTVRSAKKELLDSVGIPEEVLPYMRWRATFDTRDAERALKTADITCPALETYAWRIWDHWERHLDPDLHKDRSLRGAIGGKRVMVTGASSGIGKAMAEKIAEAGATVLLVARSEEKLTATAAAIRARGGEAVIHCADLSTEEGCSKLIDEVQTQHGGIDVLINNAGRSIRRSVGHSYDRFHDFQRTMALNYFGAVKLILGFLPGMRDRRAGHVINISSMGVQTNAPRFSGYIASKAALDAFSRSIASEVIGDGVHVTTVYMPLVRTPMIAPTKLYDAFPAITPDEAADMVLETLITRQKRAATRLGTFGEIAYAVSPKLCDRVLHVGYRIFPESTRSREGDDKAGRPPQVSTEALAFAHLLKGIHW